MAAPKRSEDEKEDFKVQVRMARAEYEQFTETAKRLAGDKQRASANKTLSKIGKELIFQGIKVIKSPETPPVEVPVMLEVPCGEAMDLESLYAALGESHKVPLTGRAAELATEHSFVARANGWSNSDNTNPRGINHGDMLLLVPLDEYSGAVVAGKIVLAKLCYSSGEVRCTLKEFTGRPFLKANNPAFQNIDFGPDIESVEVWAVCVMKLEQEL